MQEATNWKKASIDKAAPCSGAGMSLTIMERVMGAVNELTPFNAPTKGWKRPQ